MKKGCLVLLLLAGCATSPVVRNSSQNSSSPSTAGPELVPVPIQYCYQTVMEYIDGPTQFLELVPASDP